MQTLRGWMGLFGALVAALGLHSAAWAQSMVLVQPNAAQTFIKLPPEANHPEGLAANPQTGELFVGTFEPGGTNFLLRFDKRGKMTGRLDFGRVPLLGLAFNEIDSKVYIAVPGALVQQPSRIQRVPADFAANTPIENVAVVPMLPPLGGAMPGRSLPNGITFRLSTGELFFTDSVQGAVFRIDDPSMAMNTCPDSSRCVETEQQPTRMLISTGMPPLGAAGLTLLPDETRLLITNTGDDRLVVVRTGGAQGANVLTSDIDGADGLFLGPNNTVVAAASRSDQVVVLDNSTGRRLATLGAFMGVAADGSPIGLSAPVGVVVVGNDIFVTNSSMPSEDGSASMERQVRVPTISKIPFPPQLLAPRE